MNVKRKKQMTYEEIARKYDITAAKAHTVVKTSYNKIIKALVESEGLNIFEAVLCLREYFNMTETEAFEKLTDEYKEKLTEFARKEFGVKNDDLL